ncbi:hypothetical protein [Lentzea sp. CA-135723]|uniref:hypothetical protein n=1 Tax=Lentzea sp. CA-135723 TaxID=3239950 RepID=UPI003D9105CA
MDVFDYERWLTSMNELATRMTAGFQEKFGFPPYENGVERAEGEPEGLEALPAPLAEFYRHVAEVSLMNVFVGYAVWPAQHTISGLQGVQPIRLEGPGTVDVVTFGSDGGGTLFALGLPAGAPVYLLPPSGVDRSGVYDNSDSRAKVVATTLPEFLGKLHDVLEDVVHDRFDPSRHFA